jgi:hypothetical protein
LACIATVACSENGTQTVVIDKSDCVQFTNGFGSSCAKWAQYGSFTIVVNAIANSCAVSFEYPEDHSRKFYKQDSLTYIDTDNWECRVEADSVSPEKVVLVASMSQGKLRSVEYRSTSGVISEMTFTVRSRLTGGALRHLLGL